MTGGAAQSLRWMTDGHAYLLARLRLNGDRELEGPSRLPGWSGRHLLSHLGYNARALGRLVDWARTGEPTPMYASPDARVQEIEAGAAWPVPRLRAFVEEEQDRLAAALDGITDTMWDAEVVTAQGRTVPACTIPWLRTREVWIHACDLPSGGDFADFPDGLVDALIDDALTRRRTAQGVELSVHPIDRTVAMNEARPGQSRVEGPAADLVRWLTGRGTSPGLRTSAGAPLPRLPAWL